MVVWCVGRRRGISCVTEMDWDVVMCWQRPQAKWGCGGLEKTAGMTSDNAVKSAACVGPEVTACPLLPLCSDAKCWFNAVTSSGNSGNHGRVGSPRGARMIRQITYLRVQGAACLGTKGCCNNQPWTY